MIQPLPDIRPADRIDADWMTRLLRARGTDATVQTLEMAGVGTGQTGECARFRLDYAPGSARGPASMIGKFPSSNPESFRIAMAQGDYEREVKFYRDLAPGMDVATPQCLMAEIDETGRFVLLLEDLSPARQGDQLAGVTIEQARLVVDQAARLHAAHWNDPAIEALEWVKLTPRWRNRLPDGDAIRQAAAGFCTRFANLLAEPALAACRRYAERVEHYRGLPRANRALAHYDFRPDNMMFATPEGGRPVTILDWQTLSLAPGADDLAYFIAGALPAEARRAHEPELLQRYLDGLHAKGVVGYAMAQLERDYALGGFRLLATAMGGAMAVQRTERGDRMFAQMAGAAAAHVIDHRALDYLD